jgi:predicted nucleic acid-binding protein
VTLFVDASMFYAAADRGDRSNGRAKAILAEGERLLTSDHVLVETWFLIGHRLGRAAAERFWEALRSGAAAVEPVGAADLEVAFAIGVDFADQGFSIVDRTSFAVMQRLGVHRAAALDEHFAIFRFGRQRSRAFEIVR